MVICQLLPHELTRSGGMEAAQEPIYAVFISSKLVSQAVVHTKAVRASDRDTVLDCSSIPFQPTRFQAQKIYD